MRRSCAGYSFNRSLIAAEQGKTLEPIPVTEGQLAYELSFLAHKVAGDYLEHGVHRGLTGLGEFRETLGKNRLPIGISPALCALKSSIRRQAGPRSRE